MPTPLPTPTPPSSPLSSGAGKPAVSAIAPVPQQPASNQPSVKVYDEIEHVCQANETFESLSKQYFMGSPNYAKALQRHNQQHARASKRMGETGQITPGEKVFIPQAYILEERYADTIPRPATSTSSTTVPAKFDPSSGSPPLIPTPIPPPAAPAPLTITPMPNPR